MEWILMGINYLCGGVEGKVKYNLEMKSDMKGYIKWTPRNFLTTTLCPHSLYQAIVKILFTSNFNKFFASMGKEYRYSF